MSSLWSSTRVPRRAIYVASLVLTFVVGRVPFAAADNVVLQWSVVTNDAVLTAGTNPQNATRVTAMVYAAMYDALNGLEHRYEELYVLKTSPGGASSNAAVIQAAYWMLARNYPPQAATLLTRRNVAIDALRAAGEHEASIQRGVAWGETVAMQIWNLKLNDGFNPPPPPFIGSPTTGVWRPTPPALAPGVASQFPSMTPWVLTRPSLFRAPPPPALDSDKYEADFAEVKSRGASNSVTRTADESTLAVFWTGNAPLFWNRIASKFILSEGLSAIEGARVFAWLNLAMADAVIACWDSKHRYVYFRPITAITIDDGNPDTVQDAAWTPWITTPAHPEYVSGHSSVSGAAAVVLTEVFGDGRPFSINTEVKVNPVTGQPSTGPTAVPMADRSFSSFVDALEEIGEARIVGGIHFRTACEEGRKIGRAVAEYVMSHVAGR
jgi:hypothetical protein